VAAGMNDFVSKPVAMAVLREALKKWLRRGISATPGMANKLAPSGTGEPVVFDRAGVMERLQENESLAAIVMEAFLGDTPRQIQVLRDFLQRGDAAGSALQAHSIKGASATVGGERLRKVATEMEKAANAGDLDTVGNRIADLEAQFLLLRTALDLECQAIAKRL
jgi:HPt (histidine-containing phosphotransfer) domain-containing protein